MYIGYTGVHPIHRQYIQDAGGYTLSGGLFILTPVFQMAGLLLLSLLYWLIRAWRR